MNPGQEPPVAPLLAVVAWGVVTAEHAALGLQRDQRLLHLGLAEAHGGAQPGRGDRAQALDPYLDVLKIVHLVCPDLDAMVERMKKRAIKENRLDDADERVIRRRFEVYERETSPVLAHYPSEIITDISAIGSPAEVLEHVLEAVVPVQNEHFHNPLGSK